MSEDKTVIVGVSCRLSKIDSLCDLWHYLVTGESIISTSRRRYSQKYVGGFIDNICNFDANFFNISPKEAMLADPQIRIMLEKVHHAIEDSTLSIKSLQMLQCGVFVTSLPGDYKYLIKDSDAHFGFAGNTFSSLSGRISFVYGLDGPSMSVDTACSSGLYAIQLADLHIQSNCCQTAIVGGVTIFSTDEIFQMLNNTRIYSSTGTSLPFCKDANGLVPAEGCVCFVLTKLSIAERLNLPIYAQIEKVKVSHDGHGRGFLHPNEVSQANLLKSIYCDINPNRLAYLETHGTGTIIGDATEINSLRLGISQQMNSKLMLGACKSIVGHTLVTSGLVSIAKAISCFMHNTIPPEHHIKDHELINGISQNFAFSLEHQLIDDCKDLIGISAFGFTGSNGHIVLKKYENEKKCIASSRNKNFIFPVSAKSKSSLLNIACSIRQAIDDTTLDHLEYILHKSLNTFRIRVAFVASTVDSLRCIIDDFLERHSTNHKISNAVVYSTNSSLDRETSIELDNWIKNGDEKIFSSFEHKFLGDITYRNKYPFNEQCFWINGDMRHDNVITNDICTTSIGFMQEYLTLDNSCNLEQVNWLKGTLESNDHLILLPPLNGNYKMWFFQIRKFTNEKFQLHIPFYPYHGHLSKKPQNVDFEQIICDLYQYICNLKTQPNNRIYMIGWSIGGCFSLLLSIKFPRVLDKLCLVSTAANFSADVFERTLDIQNELNEQLDKFRIIYESNGTINEMLSAGATMANLKDFYNFLAKFDVTNCKFAPTLPCLIFQGCKDTVISQEKVSELRNITSAKVAKFQNCGHFIPLVNPIAFNEIVLSFLRQDM